MSRPLWPEDMETLCPSVPLHMRHALAVYCNILLHIAIWPQTVGVLRRQLFFCAAYLLSLTSVVSVLLFIQFFFMYGTFVPVPPFLFIFLHLPHHTAAADMTVSHAVSP